MEAQGPFRSIATRFTRLFFFFDDVLEQCRDEVLEESFSQTKQVDGGYCQSLNWNQSHHIRKQWRIDGAILKV